MMDHLGRSLSALDDKQAAAIERRRKMEEERKARIFNEKTRTKGVDLEAIEDQIRVKKDIKDQENQRENAISNELLHIDQQLQILAARHEEARRQVAIETRNENIYHANAKRATATPPSLDFTDVTDESKLGPASALKFSGEDPDAKLRTKRQQEQISEWADRDNRLRQERAKAERDATVLYEKQVLALQQRALELQKEHEAIKASLRYADSDYNRYLAANKTEKERKEYYNETNARLEEINYQLNSDLLTEKGVTTSSVSSTRVIPYAFKGMTPEQKRGVLNEQDRQRKEKEEIRKMKEEEERKWVAQQEAFQRQALLREREVQRQKDALAKQMQEEQARLAREKKERYDNLYKNVYTNQPTDAYFGQFNTSSR